VQTLTLENDFDLDVYSDLASVDTADRLVRENLGLERFLTDSARILFQHSMERRFGIALLHRHNRLEPGECMIEYHERVHDDPALVTRPISRADATADAIPAVWATTDGRFQALEYTTDTGAKECLLEADIPPDFLRDFMAMAAHSPLRRYLGLAVVDRQFYWNRGPDDVALEYSNLMDRTNVVFLRDRAENSAKAISTAWAFDRATYDPVLGCVDPRQCARSCIKTCARNADGTHDSTHRQNHRPDSGEHLPS
jgi:hypothetical protein